MFKMFETLNLRNRLLVSVMILGVALVGTTVVGLLLAHQMSDSLQKVYNSSAPLNNLKKVSDAYVVGIVSAIQKTRNGESWESGRQTLEDSLKSIDENWKAYLAFPDASPEEKTMVLVVNATMKDNNYFMMQLREAFEGKNAKLLDILAQSNLYPVIDPIVDEISKLEDLKWKTSQKYVEQAERSYDWAFFGMVVAALFSLVLGVGISVVVALGVSRKFHSIVGNLEASASQVSAVSVKVSTASSQLAAGAADSASNLSQTSVALNDMAGVTQKNAESATQASQFMDQSQATMIKSSRFMEDTLGAMKSINQSAEKVSRIVKAIEEIALQTNILSLNASVEAARAGEHGKGFAVVAEEVRSLAQRTAQAAKETNQLIEENAQQAKSGMEVTKAAGEALQEMMEETRRVAETLRQIESANHDQSEGIYEINAAVSQMQTVTHNNNVNAKETAAASEDMALHAASLRLVVKQLVTIVEGVKKEAGHKKKPVGQVAPVPVSAAPKEPGSKENSVSTLVVPPVMEPVSSGALQPEKVSSN